jgi:glycosyltransferase involved in cell wall biosynthesis
MKIYIDGLIYSLQKGGGITRYTNELINNYINLGHEVTLIIHPKTFNQKIKNEKLKIIEINSILNINNKLARFLTYPFHKFNTERYFKNKNITEGIFHSTYFTLYNNLKIPQILTVHDLTKEKFPQSYNKIGDKIFLYIQKKSIIKADAIICDSYQTSNDLINYYGTDPSKIFVTYLGVDSFFKEKSEDDKKAFLVSKNIIKPYILFIGKRTGYKNFEKLLEAYSTWSEKDNYTLITVGGGTFTKIELDQINKLNLENNIKCFTFASEEDLVMFYNCAQCFIYPSLSEGFGLPLLEAMACGTPVVASDIPVFHEVALEIAYYFDPNSNESIVKALSNSLVKNQSKINEGLELVKKFTWENTANETIKVYEKFLK